MSSGVQRARTLVHFRAGAVRFFREQANRRERRVMREALRSRDWERADSCHLRVRSIAWEII